jgi:hypothetical protein
VVFLPCEKLVAKRPKVSIVTNNKFFMTFEL